MAFNASILFFDINAEIKRVTIQVYSLPAYAEGGEEGILFNRKL